MISKTSKVYDQIRGNLKSLLEGVVVCVDPSCGSHSSMPGWAIYIAGRLEASGTFSLNPDNPLPKRLQGLANHLRRLYRKYDPDILIYEEIPPQWSGGGGNAGAHSSLLKSVGVTLSVPGPNAWVGIMPISWKKLVRDAYVKSDEADAIEMAWVVIAQAKLILETNPPGIKKKFGRKARGKN